MELEDQDLIVVTALLGTTKGGRASSPFCVFKDALAERGLQEEFGLAYSLLIKKGQGVNLDPIYEALDEPRPIKIHEAVPGRRYKQVFKNSKPSGPRLCAEVHGEKVMINFDTGRPAHSVRKSMRHDPVRYIEVTE